MTSHLRGGEDFKIRNRGTELRLIRPVRSDLGLQTPLTKPMLQMSHNQNLVLKWSTQNHIKD